MPYTELCCKCGSANVTYRNYKNLPFCWRCADPKYRVPWRKRIEYAIKALRGEGM